MRAPIPTLALALTLAAGGATAAELERLEVTGGVAEAADRLVAAVEEAGAGVVARVDHAAGAQSVDMELPPAVKVIFGNPALGTPVMQAEPLAGYVLPLQMLVYEDAEGQTWVAWQPPAEALADLGLDVEVEALGRMEGALRNFAEAAAGG